MRRLCIFTYKSLYATTHRITNSKTELVTHTSVPTSILNE
ncbi:hypothetical protein DDB_G0278447 [Dictyostelium discoideum AX4]|uniref:Uncharacterized protein n=1 Tax=Dictyostelium discoideum TaxID=44689 RepID=Q54Y31_DICDI|nr:hypothetical protein DDB_G0278447 [Dictyostelium discoideum AX4]EAL68396.1 hypothetical protein DDB_G0278447 [Dictyostelium discoideum AX4]|eukprot:XP_642371.1 hypothetical protein DDB_G0278447 [Dictyostelium discoideum AX4]